MASLTFLQLAQEVKRETGLTGGGPVAFASASGDDLRIFNWVAWAWRDIDLMHESWLWRRASATATTSGSVTASMTLSPTSAFGLTAFGSWMTGNSVYRPTAYKVSDGQQAEQPLTFMEYDNFRTTYLVGTHLAAGLQNWTIAPNGDFMVGPIPDAAHVVNAEYIKDHVALAADGGIPTMPGRFHALIVWRALREYGGFDAASEVWQRANLNYSSMLPALHQAQLPKMRWAARPLA